MPPKKGTKKGKGKAKVKDVSDEEMEVKQHVPEPAAVIKVEEQESKPVVMDVDQEMKEDSNASGAEGVPVASKKTLTPQERVAKMAALREKMRESAIANRRDLIEESNRAKLGARELARLDRKRQLAETLREKLDAQETGEDLERKRNWEYSIEEDEEWTKKMDKKKRRADFQFHDLESTSHRKYKKDLDLLKPDLITYNLEKEKALGLDPGTLVKVEESGRMSLTERAVGKEGWVDGAAASGSSAEGLYRDANSLNYADNKPSEEAIDRVVNKLNNDMDKRRKWSRKRTNEDEGDITYINERNKVFNKKISRFYDKYTTEIRDSFERGTAV